MRAENQQQLLAMAWHNGDYDVAQEISQELFQMALNDGNPAFRPLESPPPEVEEVKVTQEGVWMLVPSPDPEKMSIDWRQVWEFTPLHRFDQIKMVKMLTELTSK